MKSFTTTLWLLAVAPLMAAAKLEQPPNGPNFSLVGGGNENSTNPHKFEGPFSGQPIHAHNGKFWFLKENTIVPCEFCYNATKVVFRPVPGAEINGPNFSKNKNAVLRLNTVKPYGGQYAYIAPNGRFSFLQPKEKAPPGSILTGFQGGDIATFQVLDPKYIKQNKGTTLSTFVCPEGSAYAIYFKSYKGDKIKLAKDCILTTLFFDQTVFAAQRYV